MPAYGKNLTPAEVTALVAFMQTLRPDNQPPARPVRRARRVGAVRTIAVHRPEDAR